MGGEAGFPSNGKKKGPLKGSKLDQAIWDLGEGRGETCGLWGLRIVKSGLSANKKRKTT